MVKPPKLPPNRRPNWGRLNEGQRRYAWEQYNLSLVRRGIPIDHPIPARNDDFSDISDDPGTPLAIPDDIQPPPTPTAASLLQSASPIPEWTPEDWPEETSFQEEFDQIIRELGVMASRPGSAAENVGTVHKRPRMEADSSDGNTATATADAGTNQGGSGGGGGVGGATNEGGYVIPRPMITDNTLFKRYVKVHKFLTYGVAPVILKNPVVVPLPVRQYYYLTSSLAEIPVEYLSLYCTPHEYTLMQPGETVVSLKVCVTQRNVRVAFETNASTTTLATLNQNKNGCSAIGLNKLPWIIQSSYNYNATAPMVPTKALAPARTDSRQYYGVNNSNQGEGVPASHVGIPIALNTYATMSACDIGALATAVAPTRGFPDFSAHFTQYDAADFVGKEIVNYSYQPSMGMVKAPPNFTYYGPNTDGNQIGTGSEYQGGSAINLPVDPTAVSYNYSIGRQGDEATSSIFAYGGKVEKCQQLRNPHGGPKPQIQPSVHVGVMPVPSLTTTALAGIPTQWTDVQSYFDVTCEMITKHHDRSEYPAGTEIEWLENEYPIGTQFNPATNATARMGLYGNQATVYMT